MPKGDLDALANALIAFSQLAAFDDPAVAEAEVNPLMVRAKVRALSRSMRW